MVLRWWLYSFVTLVELFVSTIVHMTYGFWIASSAVVLTLTGIISEEHRRSSSKVMPFLSSALSPLSGTLVDLPGDRPEHRMHSAATAFLDADVKTPVVMLHGIFGFGKGKLGKFSYWGGAELKDDRVLVPDLGALTSIHDRACALFYYLKGGAVHYGAAHAQEFGHSPSGLNYHEGHYPQWDEHHPVHFVGHSTGVQVARLLQQLLAEKTFPGHDTNENWVMSITSLSGALNGTTRVHMDGINCSEETYLEGAVLSSRDQKNADRLPLETLTYGRMLFLQRGWSYHAVSVFVTGHSGPFTNTDWILPDLSIHSAIEFNKRVKTYPNTFYFSYASRITRKVFGFTVPSSLFRVHPLLLIRSIQMSLYRFTTLPYEGYRDEDWWDNDGALNTKSQLFPCIPTPHPNQEMESDELKVGQTFQPGIWYYRVIESDHINFIINKDRAAEIVQLRKATTPLMCMLISPEFDKLMKFSISLGDPAPTHFQNCHAATLDPSTIEVAGFEFPSLPTDWEILGLQYRHTRNHALDFPNLSVSPKTGDCRAWLTWSGGCDGRQGKNPVTHIQTEIVGEDKRKEIETGSSKPERRRAGRRPFFKTRQQKPGCYR